MTSPKTGAEEVRWNLSDLYANEQALREDLAATEKSAASFAARCRGSIAAAGARRLAEMLVEYEDVLDRVGRAYTYAYLAWATNTEDPHRGALLQGVRESYSRIHQELLFFEIEWVQIDESRAETLIGDVALASHRHYLELLRLRKEHILSEPEERILSEKSVTGASAWNRFFDETLGASRYELDGKRLAQQEILSKLHDSDRDLRRSAALAFTEGLREKLRTLTFVANTILADKASDDRLRGYATWLSSRNLDNEVSDETVEALIGAVTSRFDIVARYYTLKRDLLGLDELHDYDRYAPVGQSDRQYGWDEAREIVLASYENFHSHMGKIAREFFDGRWIDAAVVGGKQGGAFSHGAVPSVHPYILMNYTGKTRDVQTLAHELGHGVHQYLSRARGVLHSDTPLTTAETASVFGEMLVFQRLIQAETHPTNRLAMLVSKIDDTIATVFRQVAMNRFEALIHTHRRENGELTTEDFSRLWVETQSAMFGSSVRLGEHYHIWWSYIPHFLHTPGYVYAYAFGELLVLALHARYLDVGDAFSDEYLELLSAGGSDWPHVLVGRLGIDLTDTQFWFQGLDAIERMVSQAEDLVRTTQNSGN